MHLNIKRSDIKLYEYNIFYKLLHHFFSTTFGLSLFRRGVVVVVEHVVYILRYSSLSFVFALTLFFVYQYFAGVVEVLIVY